MTIKQVMILVLAVATIGFTSCKDDECTAPGLSENIVGTWEVQFSGSEAEFQSDGTLVDPDDAIIGGEINGVVLDQKSWSAVGEDSLYVRAASGSSSIDATLPILKNECDQITTEIIGISVNLNRK